MSEGKCLGPGLGGHQTPTRSPHPHGGSETAWGKCLTAQGTCPAPAGGKVHSPGS